MGRQSELFPTGANADRNSRASSRKQRRACSCFDHRPTGSGADGIPKLLYSYVVCIFDCAGGDCRNCDEARTPMKVKIIRNVGCGQGAVEQLLSKLGVSKFQRLDDDLSFVVEMPKASYDHLRALTYQPHAIEVLDTEDVPPPQTYIEADVDAAYDRGLDEGYVKGLGDAFAICIKLAQDYPALRDQLLKAAAKEQQEEVNV